MVLLRGVLLIRPLRPLKLLPLLLQKSLPLPLLSPAGWWLVLLLLVLLLLPRLLLRLCCCCCSWC